MAADDRPKRPAIKRSNPSLQSFVKDRNCEKCGRKLGIETDGAFAAAPDPGSCEACDKFESLVAEMETADRSFEPLKGKGDKHKGRQRAFERRMATHAAVANFFYHLDAPEQPYPTPGTEDVDQNGDDQHGTKRSRSSTSSLDQAPPAKRMRPGPSTIRFDNSVDFLGEEEDTESTFESRLDKKKYVKGRNGASEGRELVDTSGLHIPYGKFHGLKRRRVPGNAKPAKYEWIKDPAINMDIDPAKESDESSNENPVEEIVDEATAQEPAADDDNEDAAQDPAEHDEEGTEKTEDEREGSEEQPKEKTTMEVVDEVSAQGPVENDENGDQAVPGLVKDDKKYKEKTTEDHRDEPEEQPTEAIKEALWREHLEKSPMQGKAPGDQTTKEGDNGVSSAKMSDEKDEIVLPERPASG